MQEKKDDKDKKDEKVITTKSGLKYVDQKVGEGPEVKSGDVVSVHYTGWLKDGTKFDSSKDRGQPFSVPVGKKRVIAGWDEGLQGMKAGGKRKLIIPPDLPMGPVVFRRHSANAELVRSRADQNRPPRTNAMKTPKLAQGAHSTRGREVLEFPRARAVRYSFTPRDPLAENLMILRRLIPCVLLVACGLPLISLADTAKTADSKSPFAAFVDQYFDSYFAWKPSEGTAAGLHQYDNQLEDRSVVASRGIRDVKDLQAKLAKIRQQKLSFQEDIDATVLDGQIKAELLDLETLHNWAQIRWVLLRAVVRHRRAHEAHLRSSGRPVALRGRPAQTDSRPV